MQEQKNYHAVLYTKPKCQPCRFTKRWLTEKNIDFVSTYYGNESETNEIDVLSDDPQKQEWSQKKIEKIKEKYPGIQSFPIVKVVTDDNEIFDIWGGYRPDRLQKWFKK